MTAVTALPRTKSARKVDAPVAPKADDSFARGIAVALDLLRAEQASRGQDVCCHRRHREGRPQFRFWRHHIEKLVAEPALIEGFDAVMSAAREDGQCVGVSELERVAPNEYLAGEIGADGTLPDDAIDAAWKAVEADRVRSVMDSALVQDRPISNGRDEPAEAVHVVEDDPARIAIACTATYEIAAILQVLRKTRHDSDTFLDVFNGMSLRLIELNSVARSVLGNDDSRPTEEMWTTVNGAYE